MRWMAHIPFLSFSWLCWHGLLRKSSLDLKWQYCQRWPFLEQSKAVLLRVLFDLHTYFDYCSEVGPFAYLDFFFLRVWTLVHSRFGTNMSLGLVGLLCLDAHFWFSTHLSRATALSTYPYLLLLEALGAGCLRATAGRFPLVEPSRHPGGRDSLVVPRRRGSS